MTKFNRTPSLSRYLSHGVSFITSSIIRAACVLLCLSVISYVAADNATAQTKPPAPPIISSDENDVIEIDTDLVHLDVTVTDAQGKLVTDLRQNDFKLYEDGIEKPIAFFNVEQRSGAARPVAIVFALDVSGSMTTAELERLRGAVITFAERLNRDSSVFAVMSFGMRVRVLQNFTNDIKKINRAFDRLTRDLEGLSTHTYDAVDDAVRLLARRAPRTRARQSVKRVVLVVTDGFPVGDTVAPATVIERANSAETSIFSVTLPSYSRLASPLRLAQQPLPTPLDVSGLVDKTGGRAVYANEKDFEPLFRALAEEVSSAYVLSFYPDTQKRRDGRFHTLRIEAPRGLTLRQNREGYQAKQESGVRSQ
ncbi:MAG: VWA domain-containing protein [Pyrinomonadaceae bacterium MAG19_C2-C3]|nr:VWA domain-containing protein [Pyrinomonadaceae bacterium MAG19_C2-C3]